MYALFASHRLQNPSLRLLINSLTESFNEVFSYPAATSMRLPCSSPVMGNCDVTASPQARRLKADHLTSHALVTATLLTDRPAALNTVPLAWPRAPAAGLSPDKVLPGAVVILLTTEAFARLGGADACSHVSRTEAIRSAEHISAYPAAISVGVARRLASSL